MGPNQIQQVEHGIKRGCVPPHGVRPAKTAGKDCRRLKLHGSAETNKATITGASRRNRPSYREGSPKPSSPSPRGGCSWTAQHPDCSSLHRAAMPPLSSCASSSTSTDTSRACTSANTRESTASWYSLVLAALRRDCCSEPPSRLHVGPSQALSLHTHLCINVRS